MKLSLIALMLVGCSSATSVEAPATQQPNAPSDTTSPSDTETPAEPSACDAETAKLQKGIDAAHDAKATNVVLAVKNEACGLRFLSSGPAKVDAKKLHRIGSVTKTYTASVILSLVADGSMKLEDPLSKYTTDVPNAANISVKQLLTHQSGLFSYTDDKTFIAAVNGGAGHHVFTPSELVGYATTHDPYFAPGGGWHYSNTNFILLGMIAESVGKAKLGALVKTRVFDRAGLSETFLDGEQTMTGELATGLDTDGTDITHFADPSWAWAAGSMVATPGDVVAWIEKIGSGSFYDATTQSALLDVVPTDEGTMKYGLGIMQLSAQVTEGGGVAIGHGGDLPGYHTQAFYYPSKKTTTVAIVDSESDNPNDLTLVAIETLWGKK